MTRPLNELTYQAITRVIDGLFDDNPQKWNELSATIKGFCPASIETIIASNERCGLLEQLYNESGIIQEILDTHPEYTQLFNGLIYLYAQTGNARNKG